MGAETVNLLAENAAASRAAAADTLGTLVARLHPEALLDDALDAATAQARRLGAEARSLASAHPIALGSAAAALALALYTGRSLSRARVNLGDDAASYDDFVEPEAAAGPGSDLIARNPLAAMAVGVAAGALLGLVVPASRR
jgi:hypothetical protein